MKCWMDCISESQSHIAPTVSLKCRHVCSFKWLKTKCSLVSNFILIGSCVERLFSFMKLSSSDLSLPNDSAFIRFHILEFNQYQRSDKTPFIIYTDFETLIEKMDRFKNNPEKLCSTEVCEHIP